MPSSLSQNPTTATARNCFSLALVQQLAQASKQANLAVSPLGVLAALALAMGGASGATKAAFGEVLFGTTANLEEAETEFATWLRALLVFAETPAANKEGNAVLALATSLWADQHFTLAPGFINQAQTRYNAEANTLDFSAPTAASTINSWVAQHTRGRITSIVSADALQGPPPPALLLLNAVYFRARWGSEFNLKDTRPGHFILADGTRQPAMLMQQANAGIGYLAGNGWQAVSLRYASYPRGFAMHIFQPDEPSGLPAFLAALTAPEWSAWHEALSAPQDFQVELTLPRFRVEWGANIAPTLGRLGLAPAFSGDADFSALGFRDENGGGSIDAVVHKTFLAVDEVGTEAAAITAIMWVGGGPYQPPVERVVVKIDSPFFYAIVDSQDGTLLFAGTVNTLA